MELLGGFFFFFFFLKNFLFILICDHSHNNFIKFLAINEI
jgi:hypothetical protein